MNQPEHLQPFRDAFQTDYATAEMQCPCGKTFYDNYNSGIWDDEEEIEAHRANTDHIPIDHSIGTVEFEGAEYCWECDCWHKRAEQIRNFLIGHGKQVAELFRLEKIRIQQKSDSIPTIQ